MAAPKKYYRVVLLKTTDINTVITQIEEFRQQYGTDNIHLINKGNNGDVPSEVLNKNKKWLVCYGEYSSESEAEKIKKSINGIETIQDSTSRGKGVFVFKTKTGQTSGELPIDDFFFLKPVNKECRAKLNDVPHGGWTTARSRSDRTYDGTFEFYVTKSKKIGVTIEVGLEDYIAGVIPSEIGEDAPLEALKAQAVCTRSETLYKISSRRHKGDNYELCADVHCATYAGTTKTNEQCRRAVMDTAGEVLVSDGKIIDAVYFSNSGGHTENYEDVWESKPIKYARGTLDLENSEKYSKFQSLKSEDTFKEWIDNPPADIYCNSKQKGIPGWAKPHFRWTRTYTADRLKKEINAEYGGVGRIKDIIPGERGVGGRLKSIKVVGENKTIRIYRELPIRIALGNLDSAAFRIDDVQKEGEFISSITFKGAGWGHGVGMCQTGARSRAVKGQKYKQILSAYFKSVEVKNIHRE